MRIAILYICTGKYHVFFKDFYKSCEKYFLTKAEKSYFVFSDNPALKKYERVHFYFKECEGFPNDSLFRFRTFLLVEQQLQSYDYVFFFNSNMEFVSDIDERILPDSNDGNLCCLDADYDRHYPHPCFYPYERNKKSLAYIPRGLREYRYYHAAVNGGRVSEYLDMCRTLKEQIDTDFQHGIIAIYHDESHINKYFTTHKCKSLHSEYGIPEGSGKENEAKIIIVDKTRYDTYFNKGRKTNFWGKVEKAWNLVIHIIKWYL